MDCRRKHHRAKLESQCHLTGIDGGEYPASLEDISFSGASVKVATKTHFKIGDLCDLKLSLKSSELPLKRTCEIARLDSEIIGVKFISPALPPTRRRIRRDLDIPPHPSESVIASSAATNSS